MRHTKIKGLLRNESTVYKLMGEDLLGWNKSRFEFTFLVNDKAPSTYESSLDKCVELIYTLELSSSTLVLSIKSSFTSSSSTKFRFVYILDPNLSRV